MLRIDQIEKAARDTSAHAYVSVAIENAMDTLHVESGDEFNALAIASLESVLAYAAELSISDREFFAAHKVQW